MTMSQPRKKKLTPAEFKLLRGFLQEGFSREETARQMHIDIKYIHNLYQQFKNTNFLF